jgi:hypothetical protein
MVPCYHLRALATQEEMRTSYPRGSLVTIKGGVSVWEWTARRVETHGWLYLVERDRRNDVGYIECRSVATGVVCTIPFEDMEMFDAVQEPSRP